MTNQPQEPRPALTVVIQSWWTPALAVVMLIAGLLVGYFGRGLLDNNSGSSDNLAAVSTSVPTQSGAQVSVPTATIDPTISAIQSRDDLMAFVVSKTLHFRGDPDAPVTLIEFSDYQWPYCGRFATDAGRQIIQNYVDTGKVRFGYFNFAFLGEESFWAAEAAECAGDQDAYWQYHDYIFDHQNGENQGAFSIDNLKQFAVDLGLDTAAFNDCLDSGKYTQRVQDQSRTASVIGVSSTPTFILNGQGMQTLTYDDFKQAIDAILNPVTPTP
jgi:protein-disulfide isomerase